MNPLGTLHARLVFNRRAQVLAATIGQMLPAGSSVLDVGCGDGTIDSLILAARPDVEIRGVDVLIRPTSRIPVLAYDGTRLPLLDRGVSAVTFVDVLHHTDNPAILLDEACRVARDVIIIKDHLARGWRDRAILGLMDWVGNAHHGVRLPYNYLSEQCWRDLFRERGLAITSWQTRLGLYPPPASWLFERGLHFVAMVRVPDR